MDKIEANGRTVEEAVQAAAEQLGVSIDAVEYDVEDHGAKGFLGLGGTPAVITAWVREGYVAGARPEPRAAQQAPEVSAPEPRPVESTAARIEPEAERTEDEPPPVTPAAVERPSAPASGGQDAAFVDALTGAVTDILAAMQVDAKPVVRSSDEEEVQVEIVGSDVAILIGKHGQTLDALQYLVGIIANRHVPTRRRVILDAEGYRERHRQLLEGKAREYADAVKAEGKEAVLEPQSPRDRRIIHVALADDPDVYTYSEGEGDDRHVVISPKK